VSVDGHGQSYFLVACLLIDRGSPHFRAAAVDCRPGTAAGFAMAGGLAAFLIDIGLAFSPCHGSCAGNVALIVGATVGLPLAGGFGGYYGFRKPARQLIYRAPSPT
jgi:hypothetical protein